MNNEKNIINGSIIFKDLSDENIIELHKECCKNGIHVFYKKQTNEYIYITFEELSKEIKLRKQNKAIKHVEQNVIATTFSEEE